MADLSGLRRREAGPSGLDGVLVGGSIGVGVDHPSVVNGLDRGVGQDVGRSLHVWGRVERGRAERGHHHAVT